MLTVFCDAHIFAANHDSEASDDLWKAVCEIPENEAKLQFMHKNSRCLATREIALAPVSDDNVTKLVFVNEEDGLGKFRLVEQQVCWAPWTLEKPTVCVNCRFIEAPFDTCARRSPKQSETFCSCRNPSRSIARRWLPSADPCFHPPRMMAFLR